MGRCGSSQNSPRDDDRSEDQSEEDAGENPGTLLELMLQETRQQDNRQEYAAKERNQEQPFHSPQMLTEARQIAPQGCAQGRAPLLDRRHQTLVDTEDQGDGPSGHAGNEVGGSHEEASEKRAQDLVQHPASMAACRVCPKDQATEPGSRFAPEIMTTTCSPGSGR